ncbi:hypothetical protein D3C80_1009100 [compost metagenome]
MCPGSEMRAYQRAFSAEDVGIHQIQDLPAPVIIGIAGRPGKMEVTDLLALKRLDHLPLIVIHYLV